MAWGSRGDQTVDVESRCPKCKGKAHFSFDRGVYTCFQCNHVFYLKYIEDDTMWDGTDFAHPAFLRGEDYGIVELMKVLKEDMNCGCPISGGVSFSGSDKFRQFLCDMYRYCKERGVAGYDQDLGRFWFDGCKGSQEGSAETP